ncbi:glycosyltransferase family 4 protein [Angustibacter luteus]|uniref:Glycosyltransferase family 4 protein n=1 Tax=Angustibacter luteus TaxID=658456 RepID=A0ABW1JGS8_9ACTN
MRTVHVVVPDGLDDPAEPSGGNRYDRRVCQGLAATGWSVVECPVAAPAALSGRLAAIPDGGLVLVDGLIGSTAADSVLAAANRLRLVLLVHLPLGVDPTAPPDVRTGECAALAAATAVVATSEWTRAWLVREYALDPGQVRVARPGVDPAERAPGTPGGGHLLCVGAVTPGKGLDVLVEALDGIVDLSWQCTVAGSLTRDPAFAARVRRRAQGDGSEGRVTWAGPLDDAGLVTAYAAADLLVVASRAETYGMVVTEALSRALPVVATDVGGLPDTLGHAADGARPGVLVPPDDPGALARALRQWLTEPRLRDQLRLNALDRRTRLTGWDDTTDEITRLLLSVGRSERVLR